MLFLFTIKNIVNIVIMVEMINKFSLLFLFFRKSTLQFTQKKKSVEESTMYFYYFDNKIRL